MPSLGQFRLKFVLFVIMRTHLVNWAICKLIALFVKLEPLIVVLLVFENEDIDGRMERVEKYIHTPVLDETEVNQTQFGMWGKNCSWSKMHKYMVNVRVFARLLHLNKLTSGI